MFNYKRSLAALAGLSLLAGLVTVITVTTGRGQGNSPQPLSDSLARQAFHAELPAVVPAGKRLVIEYFSAQARTAPDCQLLALNFGTHLAGQGNVNYSFAPTHVAAITAIEPLNRYTFSHPTRLYADPGVSLAVGHTTSGFECDLQISKASISGYLVDVP